jgi:hypothetical protein
MDGWNTTQVGCLYFLPYAFVNVWLVLYTWLQHTDTDIPHYADDEWNFVKGALSTVDRPYGPVLNFLHHGIGSTHGAFDCLPYPLACVNCSHRSDSRGEVGARVSGPESVSLGECVVALVWDAISYRL